MTLRATNNRKSWVRVWDGDSLIFEYKHRAPLSELRKATTSKHLEALKIEFWMRGLPWSGFVRLFNVDTKANNPII